jgi:hypothetical protein
MLGTAYARDLAAWLADELGGRVAQHDLRTGLWFRRTHKVVASGAGPSWECYVTAVSVWLWINNLGLAENAGFSVNERSKAMGFIEPLPNPFDRLLLPVYVWSSEYPPAPYTVPAVVAACRRLEGFFAALELRRGEHVMITQEQITLWNRRPTRDRLRARIRLMTDLFADAGRKQAD